jgi:hypothetical protein
MKLTKQTLKRIIKEEYEVVLDESRLLRQFSKDKEDELKQYIRDMGKDPDDVFAALGTDSVEVMGQTLVGREYPTSKPMSDEVKLMTAVGEMEKLQDSTNLNDFYDPDSTGTSIFSRVLELVPELMKINVVKRALDKAGSPTAVTAKIGKRVTYHQINRTIMRLLGNYQPVLSRLDK